MHQSRIAGQICVTAPNGVVSVRSDLNRRTADVVTLLAYSVGAESQSMRCSIWQHSWTNMHLCFTRERNNKIPAFMFTRQFLY